MQQSFLEQSPENHHNFEKRMVAYQIHLTLSNIAYCVSTEGKHDFTEHIRRIEEVIYTRGH